MGQSQSPKKISTVTPQQKAMLDQLLAGAGGNIGQAAAGFQQFLPGGGGGEAFAKQAQQRFQQQTIPSITNQFGSGSKTSSALNQALAAGGANLNTDIASMLAQAQLQASQGLGNIGAQQAQIGAGTQQFGYRDRPMPFWQQALLGGLGIGGQLGGAALGNPGLFGRVAPPEGYGYQPGYGGFRL
jgi:hypothetical protein